MRYDWDKLRRTYITGDYASLKEFSNEQNVPYAAVRKHGAEWQEQKRTLKKHKENKITERLIERQITSASDINEKHFKAYEKAMDGVLKLLEQTVSNEKINAYNLDKAIDGMQKIQKGQRLALGLDRDNGNQAAEENVARVFAEMRRAFSEDGQSGSR